MQAEYARHYEALWNRHWWWRAREQFVLCEIRRLAARRPLRHILDVGCGNGLFFKELQKFGDVRGIEPDAGLVADDGPHRARIEVRGFDASWQPPATWTGAAGGLDLVLMLDVLEHLEDDLAAARHVHSILAPGGFFLLTVPALMLLWSAHDEVNLHYRRYTRGQVRELLHRAGFVVEDVRYFFGWTILPMLLRRMLFPGKKVDAGDYTVRVPAALVNAVMYAASRCEMATVGRWGMPVGSSVIATGRKAE